MKFRTERVPIERRTRAPTPSDCSSAGTAFATARGMNFVAVEAIEVVAVICVALFNLFLMCGGVGAWGVVVMSTLAETDGDKKKVSFRGIVYGNKKN